MITQDTAKTMADGAAFAELWAWNHTDEQHVEGTGAISLLQYEKNGSEPAIVLITTNGASILLQKLRPFSGIVLSIWAFTLNR